VGRWRPVGDGGKRGRHGDGDLGTWYRHGQCSRACMESFNRMGHGPLMASWAALHKWAAPLKSLLNIPKRGFLVFKSSPNSVIQIRHPPVVQNCSNITRSYIST
jgi:hypothetical protein